MRLGVPVSVGPVPFGAVGAVTVAVAVGSDDLGVLVLLQRDERTVLRRVCGFTQRLILGGRIGEQEAAGAGGTAGAEFVHLLRQSGALVLQWNRVAVVVDRADW